LDSCIFLETLLKDPGVETAQGISEPAGQALEERVGTQALSLDLKPALLACMTGRESRRWTVAELVERLNNLGVKCSKTAIIGALAELELEMSLCPWIPWKLAEHGTEWNLAPKSELLELLSGVRKLAGISADALTDEHKAILLVTIGHRRKGGASKTRISEILRLNPDVYLDDLRQKELVYASPGRGTILWRPTPEALLFLGFRSWSDIPELRELEQWFESQKTFHTDEEKPTNVGPASARAEKIGSRRRRREIERRASVPKIPDRGALPEAA
jgi:hypothetical protein